MLVAGLAACAPRSGWQRTDERACQPEQPPVLCLADAPEGPFEVRVGERVLLPGECIEGPKGEHGGRLRTRLVVSGREVSRPWVPVRRGVHTEIMIDGDDLEVVERDRCDRRVEPDPEPEPGT